MIDTIKVCLPKSTIPYENLATEYHLMHIVKPGECIMSLWRNKRTVVIGRNQNMYKECRAGELISDGGYPARRLSGGGAVFHDLGNLNFSFLVCDEDYDVDRQLSVITEALKNLGLNAEKTGRNDVTIDGRKISGNAFLREGNNHCHHGTLLISVAQEDMVKYLTPDPKKLESKGVNSVRSRVINMNELLPSLTPELLTKELIKAFEKVYGIKSQELLYEDLDLSQIKKHTDMLASSEWLYGKNPSFTVTSDRIHFPWGSGELALKIKSGKISDVSLFTDALDETLSQKVSEILTGVLYQRENIINALDNSNLDHEIIQGIKKLTDEVL